MPVISTFFAPSTNYCYHHPQSPYGLDEQTFALSGTPIDLYRFPIGDLMVKVKATAGFVNHLKGGFD
jgi:hypothetical protein